MDIAKITKGKVLEMTDDELHGVDLSAVKCRSCSGYGNCGYKSYRIYKGNVVSICNNRKAKEFEERGIIIEDK
jgi:hypothetical protein